MSRGQTPVFAFPTLFPQLALFHPTRDARFPPLARAGIRRPKRLPFPTVLPFNSTVCDFRDFSALEDEKHIKITHGAIEIRGGEII